MSSFRQHYEHNGRWTEWIQPVRRGYKLACCDCCLVHDMDFRIVGRPSGGKIIQFRVARNNRSTAMMRRWAKARKAKR